MERAGRATDCHVHVVEEKDSANFLMMKNVGAAMTKSMLKHLEAMEKFQEKRNAFMTARKQITAEIEEARLLWKNTLEKLPDQPFSK
jgi:hypothetical protein